MISIVSYVLISYLTLLFHALSIISLIASSHAQEHLADKSLAMKGEGKCLSSHPWQTISSSLYTGYIIILFHSTLITQSN